MKKIIDYFKQIKLERTTLTVVLILLVSVGLILFVLLSRSLPQPGDDEINPYTPTGWAADRPQLPAEIEDLSISLPYRSQYFTITQKLDGDIYVVQLAPFVSKQDVTGEVINIFMEAGIGKFKLKWQGNNIDETEEIDLTEMPFS